MKSPSASISAASQHQQQQQQCNHKVSSRPAAGDELIFDFHTLPTSTSYAPTTLLQPLNTAAAVQRTSNQETEPGTGRCETATESTRRREYWKKSVAGKRVKQSGGKDGCKDRNKLQQRSSCTSSSGRVRGSSCLWPDFALLSSDETQALDCDTSQAIHRPPDTESEAELHLSALQTAEQAAVGGSGREQQQQTEEMLRILRFMIRKQESDEIQSQSVKEWRLLALAIDKILFWIFLLVTFASSFIFLLYIPIRRRGFSFLFG